MESVATARIQVTNTNALVPRVSNGSKISNSGQEFASELLKMKSAIKKAGSLENAEQALHKIQNENREISVSDVIQNFSKTWNLSNQKLTQTMAALPMQSRPFFEAQLLMSKVSLDSQIITRVADTMGASVRKLLQMGGN